MGITWDVSGFTPHLLSQKPCRSGLAVSSTVSPGPELAFVSLPSGREQREERGGRGRKGHHSGGDGDLGSWMGSVCVCVLPCDPGAAGRTRLESGLLFQTRGNVCCSLPFLTVPLPCPLDISTKDSPANSIDHSGEKLGKVY